MRQSDIPQRWVEKINEYLKQTKSEYKTLSVTDFEASKELNILFEDGSFAAFQHALVIDASELDEVGVFTEHCGYFFIDTSSISKVFWTRGSYVTKHT